MKAQYVWRECPVCAGKRFVDNRLCPECGGDGVVLTLAEVEPTEWGLERLLSDVVFDPN